MANEKILIVEDEAITALHLQHQLSRMGYQVSGSVASGEEAVRVAQECNPDLIIMDVKLAGAMDGVEASRRIRENRPVPIVYLTAYPNVFLQSPAAMQQPGICISKPFSGPALEISLTIALNTLRASPANC